MLRGKVAAPLAALLLALGGLACDGGDEGDEGGTEQEEGGGGDTEEEEGGGGIDY